MSETPDTGSSKPQAESFLAQVDATSGGIPIRERYGFVLLLLLVAYVLAGIDAGPVLDGLLSIIWISVLLAALWSPGIPRRLRQLGVVATGLVLVSSISLNLVATDEASGWRLLIFAVAQAAALLAILNRILRHERVNFQTVMGGVAAYALIAFVMAAAYHGLELLSDETFLNGVVAEGDFTYFSFVTLTTVGYGDITAASDLAKRLVVIEAFVGQVFIITLVARLVSLWGQPLRRTG
jgi:voltage-gated potassium channel Kch